MRKKNFYIILKIAVTIFLLAFLYTRISYYTEKLKGQVKEGFSIRDIFIVDEEKIKKAAATKTLNQLIPDFDLFVGFVEGKVTVNEDDVRKFRRYYEA